MNEADAGRGKPWEIQLRAAAPEIIQGRNRSVRRLIPDCERQRGTDKTGASRDQNMRAIHEATLWGAAATSASRR